MSAPLPTGKDIYHGWRASLTMEELNYRTLDGLFRICQERSGVIKNALFVSMLEDYSENMRDLLLETSDQPPKRLEIKQAGEELKKEVPGLVEAHVSDTEEVWDILKSGSRARSVGSTQRKLAEQPFPLPVESDCERGERNRRAEDQEPSLAGRFDR